MKLTNKQIEDAMVALEQFNPAVSLKLKLRLSRNLRKLRQAHSEKEQDRIALMHGVVKDKNRQAVNGQIPLTAEEMGEFSKAYRGLMTESQEVEVHQVQIADSTELDANTRLSDDALDAHKIPVPNAVLEALIDVIFTA